MYDMIHKHFCPVLLHKNGNIIFDIMDKLYSSEIVYRPPQEEGSALLEVTAGCSYRKCTFCDFARDPFKVFSLQEIENKAQLLNSIINNNSRLFLLGQNPFVLSPQILKEILIIVSKHLPSVKEVSMYARVDDINRKTHAELRELKSLGLKDLHVGVETGSDIILKKCNKGISLDDMLSAFDALEKAEIEYSVTSILGLGGRALSDVNALDTAALYNRIHPNWIWCMALKLWENTPLFKLNAEGQFDMLTPKEMLLEERLMLENMQTDNCCFVDSTALNQYTLIGRLKKGKDTLIKALDQLIQTETN